MICSDCGILESHGHGKYPNICSKCRCKLIGRINKERLDELKKSDPNCAKKNSNRSIEYWLSRGFTEKQAKEELKKISSEHSRKLKDAWKNGNFSDRLLPTNVEYWLEKGIDKDTAEELVSDRQRTFTLDKCIEKYGEIEGSRRWNDRQKNWQESLKSREDYETIQKKKGITLQNYIDKFGEIEGQIRYEEILKKRSVGFSKISQELFWKIYESLTEEEKEKTYFYELNHEFAKSSGEQAYLYDFVISSLGIVIEFHGDIWHANPNVYTEESYKHPFNSNLTFAKIHKQDKRKRDLIESNGFTMTYVWESDFKKQPNEIIDRLRGLIENARTKIH